MPEYLVMLTGDEHRWEQLSEEEQHRVFTEHGRFGDELAARGHTITSGAELHPSSLGRRIEGGSTLVTAGPFAEEAEQIGGYYRVQSEDLDDLMECCLILAALGDQIDVRLVVEHQEQG